MGHHRSAPMPTSRWNWRSASRPKAPAASSTRETSAISSASMASATYPNPSARSTSSEADPLRGTESAATTSGKVTRKT
jgi:hypothetical protein